MSTDEGRKVASPAELRQDIDPARDLWPGIAARIAAESAPRTRLPAWPRAAFALAAAVACVAFGALLGRSWSPAGAPPVATANGDLGVQPAVYAPGARFERTRANLLREVSANLAQLSPETRARVEASLATVQRARADIEQALGHDPGNALLQEMLLNSYQDEMRVLTTVSESWVAREEIGA